MGLMAKSREGQDGMQHLLGMLQALQGRKDKFISTRLQRSEKFSGRNSFGKLIDA
jgi:hypothetical protein